MIPLLTPDDDPVEHEHEHLWRGVLWAAFITVGVMLVFVGIALIAR